MSDEPGSGAACDCRYSILAARAGADLARATSSIGLERSIAKAFPREPILAAARGGAGRAGIANRTVTRSRDASVDGTDVSATNEVRAPAARPRKTRDKRCPLQKSSMAVKYHR